MIHDNCRCGAELKVKRRSIYSEMEVHDRWLAAHRACRAVTYPKVPSDTEEGS